MSITDELRGWMNDNYPAWKKLRTGVSDQLDRIDAVHEEAIQREHESAYDMGYAEGSGAGLATVALGSARWLDEHEDEMVKHGFVHLPKDADGEYIHIGDDMETLIQAFRGEHCRVEYIALTANGWEIDGDAPDSMRHHKQPTVEDVLHDFICDHEEGVRDEADLIAEYAKRLRLAGSDAE